MRAIDSVIASYPHAGNHRQTHPITSVNSTQPATKTLRGLQCPICPYVTSRPWKSDLKRHTDTHSVENRKWFCAGVPEEHAHEYDGLDISKTRWCEKSGRMMVGGCGTSFSRKESYKRHLERQGQRCQGDLRGIWFEGAMTN